MNFYILCVYLYVSVRGGERKSKKGRESEEERERKREKHGMRMWRPEYHLWKSSLFLYHVGLCGSSPSPQT